MGSPLLLLNDTFGRLHDSKVVYDVRLYPKEIVCQPNQLRSKQYAINLSSVVGCRCMKASSGVDHRSFLTIYAYPKNNSCLRRRQTYTFFYEKASEYEKNFAVMRKWKLAISYLVSSSSPDLSVLNSFLKGEIETLPFPERRWLVLVNPFSGTRRSEKVFGSLVSNMFAEAELDYTVVKTEYSGHARDFIRQAQLDSFTGIVTVSGDGLLCEVVNGLLARPDWQDVCRKPIGVVPCGSGNGLASMLCTIAGERIDRQHALHATFQLLRPSIYEIPGPRPWDLMAVDTVDGRMYSFLDVAWGIIADIDIESERYRCIGNARIFIGSLARLINLRTYRGRISFLPVDPAEAKQTMQARRNRHLSSPGKRSSISGNPQTVISDDGQRHTLTGSDAIDYPSVGRYRSYDDLTSKSAISKSVMNGSTSSLVNTTPVSVANKNPFPGSAGSVNVANNSSFFAPIDCPDGAANNSGTSSSGVEQSLSPQLHSYIETPLLPAKVTDPVPLNWMTIEDAFIGVVGTRSSHLGSDTGAHPGIRPSDGAIWLMLTRAPVSRQVLFRQFVAMNKGDVDMTNNPLYAIECYRVYAFRIEPFPSPSETRIMAVDGERITYGPVQCQILPRVAALI